MTVFGWDASDFDWSRGPMDLVSAKAAGVRFFTHKATEGTSVHHSHYGEALQRARDAGIGLLGAYIVPRTGPTPAAQVDYLLQYVDAATPWWRSFPGFFFQVDTEHWSYDQVSPAIGEAVAVALRARTGRWVVHYAPGWAYGNSIPGSTPLWASDYGTNPVAELQAAYPGDQSSRWHPYSGRVPTFLQYGSQLTIGTQAGCDGNAFRGSYDELYRLITGTTQEDDMSAHLVYSGTPDTHVWFAPGYPAPSGKAAILHITSVEELKAYTDAGFRQVHLPAGVSAENTGIYDPAVGPWSNGDSGSTPPAVSLAGKGTFTFTADEASQ